MPGHIDEASLREQLEVNLVAPLRLGEQALEVLEPGGGMVFISSTIAGSSMTETVRELWPFFFVALALLFAVSYIPALTIRF